MNAAEKTKIGLERISRVNPEDLQNVETYSASDQMADQSPAHQEEPRVQIFADQMYVLDTTARPGISRVHELMVKGIERPYTFEYGKPTLLSRTEAVRFLEIDAFKHTDAEGNVLDDYRPVPKQPENVQAGEVFALEDDQTIARFDELLTDTLQHRCIVKHGGDRFAESKDRARMIKFLMDAKPKRIKPVARVDADDYLVELLDEEAA